MPIELPETRAQSDGGGLCTVYQESDLTMDDELKELQRLLAAAQTSTAVHRLSEGNCVDIVLKLQAMGAIELLKTNNGREFITPKQVESEIHMEVERHGGRKNLTDLCIPLVRPFQLLVRTLSAGTGTGYQFVRRRRAKVDQSERRALPVTRRTDHFDLP